MDISNSRPHSWTLECRPDWQLQVTAARDCYRRSIEHLRIVRNIAPTKVEPVQDLEKLSRRQAVIARQLGDHAALADAVAALIEAIEGQPATYPDPAKEYCLAAQCMAHCLVLARSAANLSPQERTARAQEYGDKSMHFLQKAVDKGYRDVKNLKRSLDLEPVRSREDFQHLIADLEQKALR
jgi:hypothetical protein